MNIKLKSEILEKSIKIETYLSQILMRLLDIENNDSKTLGTKGSALSLKSKTDLLYDINKIDSQLYKDLIIFMEIRNQFIHNHDTNSYEFVINRVNKEKRIMEFFSELNFDKDLQIFVQEKEVKLKAGFKRFYFSVVERLITTEKKVVTEKTEILNQQIKILEKEHELEFKDLTNKALADSIDDAMNLLDSSLIETEFGKLLNPDSKLTDKIKSSIFGFLEKNMRKEIDKRKKENES